MIEAGGSGFYPVVNPMPHFQPYDVVKLKCGSLSIVTEVHLNLCQTNDEWQWSYAVTHIQKSVREKNAWYKADELVYVNNIFEIIAQESRHPFSTSKYKLSLERR